MTTFESLILLVATLIVIMLLFFGVVWKLLDDIKGWQKSIWQELRGIRVNVADTAEYTHNHIAPDVETLSNNFQYLLDGKKGVPALFDIVDKMHRNLCVEIADKVVERTFPIKEEEPLDAAFEPDYKLKKDIECKLNGFAAAVLDAECCPKEIVDFWLERICDAAHKYIKQLKIDWDKLSKKQQDEFLKRLIMPNYDNPFQPPFNPTCETTNNSDDVYAECRRMDAINTASVCENMTKIQKELQKKGGQHE